MALIGEAAGLISPSSAEGISYAFISALALADALREDFDKWEASFREKTPGLRRNIRLKSFKAGILYNPLLRKLIMKTGIISVPVRRKGGVAL